MNLEPLLHASLAIQLHVLTVVPAAFLGAYILLARKGTPVHRMLGKIWVVLMIASALSSFFIHQIRLWGAFSPIHLLSVLVILSSLFAIHQVRRGNIKAHKASMVSVYIGGIFGAGVFTFWPGRIMNRVFLGGVTSNDPQSVQHAIVAAAVIVVVGYAFAGRMMRTPVRRATRS